MGNLIFAIDLGGTSTKLAILDEDGEFVHKWQIPTNTRDHGKHIINDIHESFRNKLIELNQTFDQFIGVGIGAPGAAINGVILQAINLGWENYELKNQLEELLQLPVFVENDANCAALGEMWKGAGQGFQNLVCMTLGTGVGGGVIIKGNIVEGLKGAAGEIGHITVKFEDGIKCNCGKLGCLETVASARGILHVAKERLQNSKTPTELTKIKSEEFNTKVIFDVADRGDSLALNIIDEVASYLGYALGTLDTVLDPDAFIIGGGVSHAGETLLRPIRKYYAKYAYPPSVANTKILQARLGNDAGVIGAGWLVKRNIILN